MAGRLHLPRLNFCSLELHEIYDNVDVSDRDFQSLGTLGENSKEMIETFLSRLWFTKCDLLAFIKLRIF